MSFGGVASQALALTGSLRSGLRCSLQVEGFSTAELRCGLFGSDLELLDANECPENLGCSRSAVLWASADAGNDLATIDLQLDELPNSLEHLVLATVGKTGAEGGCLFLSIAAGQFHQQYRRSQSPEHGRGAYAQGCMLAVLSRRSQGWLLQEVVPNIGLSCEQQEDAIVRELYWPEVGVAIERTVTTEDGPSITWLEVFRAYPEGTYPSDDDAETASHASPLGSHQPELVTSVVSPGSSELGKASLASAASDMPSHMRNQEYQTRQAHHTRQTPSSLFRNGREDFLPFEELKDFGPPRAAGKALLGSESQVAELCQEAGRLSVSLKLSEDRLSKSESLVAHLRSEMAQLREDNLSFTEESSRKDAKLSRLRSELDHCMSELQQRTVSLRAQHAEVEEMMKLRAKELTTQERCKGEVAALQKELTRVNQQLLEEKGTWEQEKESLRLSLQERTAEAKAAKLAQGSDDHLENLRQELFLQRAEAARCRTELLEARKAREKATDPEASASSGHVRRGNSELVEMLQAELSKLQSSFAEELGSARARLAVAEKCNKDLLENLQSTVRAANCVRAIDRPTSLPEPPSVLPQGSDWKSGLPVRFAQKGLKPEDRGFASMTSHLNQGRQSHSKPGWESSANGSRHPQGDDVCEWHSQHRDRTERLAHHQQELQWQLHPSTKSASSEAGKLETDSAWVSHSPIQSRDFGRLPSAPSFASSSNSSLGDTLRKAVAERRRSREHKATRSLDDEYTRFVKEGPGKGFRHISSRDVMNIREARHAPREPFVLTDLGSG